MVGLGLLSKQCADVVIALDTEIVNTIVIWMTQVKEARHLLRAITEEPLPALSRKT